MSEALATEATLALFAPPSKAPADFLDIGTRVRYSHRAAVIRHFDPHGWVLTEGRYWHDWRPPISRQEVKDEFGIFEHDPWYTRPRQPGQPNKSLLVWPEEGEAVLIGFVRRGIGRSTPPSGYTSTFEDSYEPGYFQAERFVPLYAIKPTLQGVAYMLAPTWAVRPA